MDDEFTPDSAETTVDTEQIRSELDAIGRHVKNLFKLSGGFVLQNTSNIKEDPAGTLESAMKKNPLLTTLGVFAAGVFLGKLLTSCRKKH